MISIHSHGGISSSKVTHSELKERLATVMLILFYLPFLDVSTVYYSILQGGLGNQLTQYVYALYLSKLLSLPLCISDCLYSSRKRRLGSVTTRSLCPIFCSRLVFMPAYISSSSTFIPYISNISIASICYSL